MSLNRFMALAGATWLAILAIVLVFAFRAHAHDRWADGEPVPAWVKATCCGVADAHHLTPAQVHRVTGGMMVDGYPDVIPFSQWAPSPDGEYWVFFGHAADGSVSRVYCAFAPYGSS
jgi:hypothetical protein